MNDHESRTKKYISKTRIIEKEIEQKKTNQKRPNTTLHNRD